MESSVFDPRFNISCWHSATPGICSPPFISDSIFILEPVLALDTRSDLITPAPGRSQGGRIRGWGAEQGIIGRWVVQAGSVKLIQMFLYSTFWLRQETKVS